MAPSAIDEFLGARPSSKWRRRLSWVLAAAAAVVVIVLIGRFVNGGEATRYATTAVRRGDLQTAVVGAGTLQPVSRGVVAAPAGGVVLEVLVRPGDRIVAQQVIARLDPAAAVAAVGESQSLIATRGATLGKAQAAAQEARDKLARFEAVRRESDNKVPSDREMGLARDAARRAGDAVSTAQVELEAARATLAERQADIAAADIRAPADGVIESVLTAPGRPTTIDQPLFNIAAPPARLLMEVMVDAKAAQTLKAGTAAEVTPNGGKRGHAARVTSVRPSRTAGAEQAIVALDVDNADLALKPDMAVEARIGQGVRRDVLLVPETALRFGKASDARRGSEGLQGDAVYVLGEQGAPRRVAVTIEGGDGQDRAVSSPDLSPGAAVIVGLR
ncbi:MAG: hypothetical protein BGN86_17170 [Caulobacterales bacterium 68-7]|nr:MAG: hypothetical protein BGN86_17170 [Caulobacterales bacterium 68-7]